MLRGVRLQGGGSLGKASKALGETETEEAGAMRWPLGWNWSRFRLRGAGPWRLSVCT